MRHTVFLIFLLSAFASIRLFANEISCPPGNNFPPQNLGPTEIPNTLEQIFTKHKGNGFFAIFAEEKKVALLQRPLRSVGELIFFPQKGLYRKLNRPFHQEMLITQAAIWQRDDRGTIEMLDLSTVLPARALVDGFLTVFSRSWEAIDEQFRIYVALKEGQWRLGLLPKHTMMSQLITCIILEGEKDEIRKLWVHESSGDITYDEFSDAQIITPEHWKDYQGYFDWGRHKAP